MTEYQLAALLQEVGLGHLEEKLMQVARPSLRLHLHPRDETAFPIGATKFGGSPDLPLDFEWPVWQGYPESDRLQYSPGEFAADDGPLCFLAQFRLEDLAAYELGNALPGFGMLYFFCAIWKRALGYDEGDRDCWKVFLYEGEASDLKRHTPPLLNESMYHSALLPKDNQFDCCRIEFQYKMTLPDWNDPESYEPLALSEDESDSYVQLLEMLGQEEPESEEPIHRLLGYPQIVQWGKEVPDKDQEWRLLLQLDTEDAVQLHWQAMGRGYFYIPASALAEQNFDAVWDRNAVYLMWAYPQLLKHFMNNERETNDTHQARIAFWDS